MIKSRKCKANTQDMGGKEDRGNKEKQIKLGEAVKVGRSR